MWISAAVCAIMATVDYFFTFVVWNVPGRGYILSDFIIPAHLAAVMFSPLIYLAVRGISRKFSLHERVHLSSAHDNKDEEDYK
jgi:hypothetical protein